MKMHTLLLTNEHVRIDKQIGIKYDLRPLTFTNELAEPVVTCIRKQR